MSGPPMGPPMGHSAGNPSGPFINNFPDRPMGPGNEMFSQRPPNHQSRYSNPSGPPISQNSWIPNNNPVPSGPRGPTNFDSFTHNNQGGSMNSNGPSGPNNQIPQMNQMMNPRHTGPPTQMSSHDEMNLYPQKKTGNDNIGDNNQNQDNLGSSNQLSIPGHSSHQTDSFNQSGNQNKFQSYENRSSSPQNLGPHGPNYHPSISNNQGFQQQSGRPQTNSSNQQDISNQNRPPNGPPSGPPNGPSNFRSSINYQSQNSNFGPRGSQMHGGPQFSTPKIPSYTGPREGPNRSQHGPRTVWEAPSPSVGVKEEHDDKGFGDVDERNRDIDERNHHGNMQWEPAEETGRTDKDFYENVDRPISLLDMDTESLKRAWDERSQNNDSPEWCDESNWGQYNFEETQNTSSNFNRGNWRGRSSSRGGRGIRGRGKPVRRNMRSRGGRSR